MAENKTVILKASGLQTSPNELSREDGALIEASNVIIKRDNIVEQSTVIKEKRTTHQLTILFQDSDQSPDNFHN